MPTIKLVSDLHFVNHPTPDYMISSLEDEDVDILVVAGDIANGLVGYGLDYLEALSKICSKLVFVLGNHDMFFSRPDVTFAACYDFMNSHSNTYILENNKIEIDGAEFIGATMWYPHPNSARIHSFVDFVHIPGANPWIFNQNEGTCKFFEENIHEDSIVVTHHMPSSKSTPPQYIGDSFNEFFVCEMDYLIWNKQPKLWLHGHTHTACDYTLGNTRVVCNPYGYFGFEKNTGFKNDLKITV